MMKTKGLTLRETLQACRDMWQWMATTLDWSKSEYFKIHGVKFEDRPRSSCFACQWAYENYNSATECYCRICPLKNIWGEDCCNVTSPYLLWDNADREEDRKEPALAIVKGCNEALAALPVENKVLTTSNT